MTMTMPAIDAAADALLAGADAPDVIAKLRETYTTPYSMSNALSNVRFAVLARNRPPKGYEEASNTMKFVAFVFTRGEEHTSIHAFLNAPLVEQYRIQKQHAKNPTWSEHAKQRPTTSRPFESTLGIPPRQLVY